MSAPQHLVDAGAALGQAQNKLLLWLANKDSGDELALRLFDPKSGVATSLLNRLFELTREDDRRGYTLEVRVSNAGAIALYERLGFEARGVRRGYYTDNREDAVIMWRDATPVASDREAS